MLGKDQEDLTAGWLFLEVIRQLNQKGVLQQFSGLAPVSLSTKSGETECIDYYLTKMD